ncbi:PLP-dependent decarboxylase [Escherichia coli]|nr:PLP-dependent decarboxylase [Escherichia coli]
MRLRRKMVRPLAPTDIGSSEACMLGGMAMKWRWRKRMEAAGNQRIKTKPGVRSGTNLLA